MRRLFAALGLALLASCRPAPPHALRQGYYVWQYDWTPAVADGLAAAARAGDATFLVMAGAIGRDPQPHPDWRALAAAGRPVVPVLRIFAPAAALLAADPARLRAEVLRRCDALRTSMAAAGLRLDALQLDLDCPERLLGDYARFLASLRPALPGIALSVTALPSHLDRRDFARVAAACDGYTLQVHGLAYPRTIGEPAALVDAQVARTAIDRAQRLGRPFDVALPTYAHELVFDRAGGALRGLAQPMDPDPDPARFATRVVAADPAAVAALYAYAARAPACRGAHWFRLPVPGDAMAWDLGTLARVRAGEPVSPALGASAERSADGRWLLVLTNRATLAGRAVRVDLAWPAAAGDFGLYGGRVDGSAVPGILPEHLCVPPPAPGQARTAAWFRVASPPRVLAIGALERGAAERVRD